jgi:hypothetical protein
MQLCKVIKNIDEVGIYSSDSNILKKHLKTSLGNLISPKLMGNVSNMLVNPIQP